MNGTVTISKVALAAIIAISVIVIAISARAEDSGAEKGGADCEAYIKGAAECSRIKYGDYGDGFVFVEGPYIPEEHTLPK
jgi:hypothetical protein